MPHENELGKTLDERLADQDNKVSAALIEQETRPTRIVHNLVQYWTVGPTSTPEQSLAAKQAFFGFLVRYFVVSRGVAAVGGGLGAVGGLIALVTLYINRDTLNEIRSQTEILSKQTAQVEQELQQSRRSSNVVAFADLVKDLDEEGESYSSNLALRIFTVSEALVPYQTPAYLFRVSEHSIAPALYKPDETLLVSPQRGALLIAVAGKLSKTHFSLRPNFTHSMLIAADLSGTDLSAANLSRSVMDFVYLDESNLQAANLDHASLKYARLFDSNLTSVDMTGSDLFLADLHGANLDDANFVNAKIEGANLRGVRNASPEQMCAAETLYQSSFDQPLGVSICEQCPDLLQPPPKGSRDATAITGLDEAFRCPAK